MNRRLQRWVDHGTTWNVAGLPNHTCRAAIMQRGLAGRLQVLTLVALALTGIPVVRGEPAAVPHTEPLAPEYRLGADGSVSLRICFNSSCARTQVVTFSAADMHQVGDQLALCAGSDRHDRLQRVRIAVWQMEILAQKYIPVLANDREVNDREYGVEGRTDCVDNASNTTTYLRILADLGKLPSWTVLAPSVRSRFDINAVHWTAVIRDQDSDAKWAVDSWFRPNGNLPFVVPLASWTAARKGWEPPYDLMNPNPRYSNDLCERSVRSERSDPQRP